MDTETESQKILQEELLGRLTEHYQRQGEEMPMGLKFLDVTDVRNWITKQKGSNKELGW